MHVEPAGDKLHKKALIGVRSCELHALAIQDKVFMESEFKDSHYKSRRDGNFIVAINCSKAGGTCFCASMNTGPQVTAGYDLLLTELTGAGGHCFLLQVGSKQGAAVAKELTQTPAESKQLEQAAKTLATVVRGMGRNLDTLQIK